MGCLKMNGESMVFSLKLPIREEMRIFRKKENVIARDLIAIGQSIFELEKQVKRGKKKPNLRIRVSIGSADRASKSALPSKLEDLFLAIVGVKVKIDIIPAENEITFSRKKVERKQCSTLVLFSGGVDSYVGLSQVQRRFPDFQAIFIGHQDQKWNTKIVKELERKYFAPQNIKINYCSAPAIEARGYSQLRGFLYLLCMGAYANLTNAKTLLVTECGCTMYQPKFGPYDSVTHTTDPQVLTTAKAVLESILSEKIKILTPFENLTKTEVMLQHQKLNEIGETYSCIKGRFRRQCGYCYGCVLRRLSEVILDIDTVDYAVKIFEDEEAPVDNLITLIAFSSDYIFDLELLGDYSLEKITKYGKEDLFRRQSLDVLVAFFLIKERKYKLNTKVSMAYTKFMTPEACQLARERLKELEKNSLVANFDKEVRE